ncbi:MAG: UDP-N-acetylmuramate--L-alanine ligase [Candidatus Daviesbacteria bacterium]
MQKVHFLGIGGSGASAAAAIASAQGYEVTGCDKFPFNEFTKVFDQKTLFEGHSPDHLENVDILAVTPAIYSLDPRNPELLEAKKKGIRIFTWQEFMGEFLEKEKFVIAVCGTHGKTTTTSIIGQLLEDAGLDPTVEVGTMILRWKANYRVGKGKYFVTEADEFNENFLVSHPNITVCTIVEMDHPEFYQDFGSYKASFRKFLSQTKEKIIANLSDEGVKEVLASQGETLLGSARSPLAEIVDYSEKLIDFPLQVPGKFNVLNASAAFQVGLALGIPEEKIKESLSNFSGVGRRFEYLGDFKGAKVYSDFGHHPTEIRVTLEALREKYPDEKILVVFQPHMFSRSFTLFDDFVKVFQNVHVDKTWIMDIYPSREVDTGKVSSKELVEAINKPSVELIPKGEEVLERLNKDFDGGGVIFFIGAGDTHKIAQGLLQIKG